MNRQEIYRPSPAPSLAVWGEKNGSKIHLQVAVCPFSAQAPLDLTASAESASGGGDNSLSVAKVANQGFTVSRDEENTILIGIELKPTISTGRFLANLKPGQLRWMSCQPVGYWTPGCDPITTG